MIRELIQKVEDSVKLAECEKEVELATMQLHQAQEELEYYFLLSRRQSKLLESSAALQKKTLELLAAATQGKTDKSAM